MMVLIREECKPKCVKAKEILETCYERVRQKESGDCDGYYLDYLSCIDYHVRQTAFPAFSSADSLF